jgi:hypothetical protein
VVLLIAVQCVDGIVEANSGLLTELRGDRVIDPRRPVFLLERGEDGLLVRGRRFELFDDEVTEAEYLEFPVPQRH